MMQEILKEGDLVKVTSAYSKYYHMCDMIISKRNVNVNANAWVNILFENGKLGTQHLMSLAKIS